MRNNYIHSVTYKINPRIKKHWFRKDETVYDLLQHIIGERWVDVTYGDGGGDFMEYEEVFKVGTFNDLNSAKKFKKELKKSCG